MKAFKKKTLALVLASVVSIAGSFASGNYKNTLTGLDFSFVENNPSVMNMVVQTGIKYTGSVAPIKKDANTYILMLPEVDSKMTVPDLTKYLGRIKDISIRTMPYTNTGKGYTKITITTNNISTISGYNKIFIPATNQQMLPTESQSQTNVSRNNYQQTESRAVTNLLNSDSSFTEVSSVQMNTVEKAKDDILVKDLAKEEEILKESSNTIPDVTNPMDEKDSYEVMLLILGTVLIVAISIFFFLRAKDRLRELSGESLEIDISEEEPKNKNKKIKDQKIRETIKKLDTAYSQTAVRSRSKDVKTITAKNEIEEELNVVDLDELFKETVKTNDAKKQTEEEENLALEEFLSGFSFDEDIVPVMENSIGYDIEFYEKVLNNADMVFSKDEIDCMNKLLNTEIDDSTLENIDKYLVSNPIKKVISKDKILEELVSTYTISQNISFTPNDINALKKLMSVEFDSDFVTDLRTNPERVEKMRKEIEDFNSEYKKSTEVMTLIVADLLPDLSEEVKKQAGKKIQSEAKAETVYFSEGYDVSTLKVDLPELSAEINNKMAYISKPSAEYDIVDNSYEVQKLAIESELPDLKDALEHPEKYECNDEKVEVDEKALLKNISNVQFKPFYDGQEFEVLNDFENAPTVNEVQQEMTQFGNFEIVDDEVIPSVQIEQQDDFVALYNNEYVDLDDIKEGANKEAEVVEQQKVEQENKPILNRIVQPSPKRERTFVSEDLLNKINSAREERKQARERKQVDQKDVIAQNNNKETKKMEMKCVFAGVSYNVLSTVEMLPNVGCHLAKNGNGYTVLGYVGDNICALKQYDELKSEKIQARKNEELAGGITRYIVRIGNVKFIVNASSDSIDYVMDLC